MPWNVIIIHKCKYRIWHYSLITISSENKEICLERNDLMCSGHRWFSQNCQTGFILANPVLMKASTSDGAFLGFSTHKSQILLVRVKLSWKPEQVCVTLRDKSSSKDPLTPTEALCPPPQQSPRSPSWSLFCLILSQMLLKKMVNRGWFSARKVIMKRFDENHKPPSGASEWGQSVPAPASKRSCWRLWPRHDL